MTCLAIFTLLTLHVTADDQITRRDGTVVAGQIVGVTNGQVMVAIRTASGSTGRIPYNLAEISSVTMTPPPDYAKAQGAAPAVIVSTLEPLVTQFAGLPADWVVDAMGQLAGAYSALGQGDKAVATYQRIDTLYPNSKYHLQAVAGQASLSVQQGKYDAAIAAVQPLIDQANQDIAPSAAEGGSYASAFLVYGQALEGQKKLEQALEAYLTVKTMFYQNPTLAAQADQLAKKLRDENPGLGVD